jgi:predicted transcriptional regulator
MINNEDFAKRLQKVIDYYNEIASSFAEKIGVQRSSISHILSGRNKPSLDFVLKVLASFPEVELYWLLNGKGNFPSEEKTEVRIPIEKIIKEESISSKVSDINQNEKNSSTKKKIIERIVIFYTDGSFKNYDEL